MLKPGTQLKNTQSGSEAVLVTAWPDGHITIRYPHQTWGTAYIHPGAAEYWVEKSKCKRPK